MFDLKRIDCYYLNNEFKKVFPELKHLSEEEIENRLEEIGIYYYDNWNIKNKTSFLIRLTLPFAILTWIGFFISMPIHFIFTGKWGYSVNKHSKLFNWISKFGLS
jgi:hypothetical protein